METSIVEGNKAIAEFIAMRVDTHGGDTWMVGQTGKEIWHNVSEEFWEFHSSWDWLMPVWKRCVEIIGLWCHTHEDNNKTKVWLEASERVSRAFSSVDINSAFNEISNLIKWYNNLQTPKQC
jgi:hypothetical protein